MNETRSVPLAPSSELPPMQPRSIFAILGAAIGTYARFPLVLLGIVAPLELPLAIINSVVAAFNPIQGLDASQVYTRTNLVNLFLYTFIRLLLLLVEVVVSFAILAAITRWLASCYVGVRLSVWQAYKGVGPRMGALLGGLGAVIGAGIVSIIFVVILAVMIDLINLQVKEDNGLVAGAGGLVLPVWQLVAISVPPSLLIGYLLMRWSLLVQVVMVEKSSANHALVRSWRLGRGRFWQVAATLLLAVAPAILLTTVFPLLQPVFSADKASWGTILFDLFAYLLRVVLLPFGFVALVLLYFDLRIRKESYSVSALAADLSDKPMPTYPTMTKAQ